MTMDAAPPSYAAPSLPLYSQIPRPEEIRVAADASQSTSHEEEYQYKHGHLLLNLGPKRAGVFRPAYGWNSLVGGYVQIKANTKKVRSIVATIQGQVTTGVSERGFLSHQTRTVVLRASQTLFDSSSGEQVPKDGARYAFSFALPSYVAGGSDPLPPSFSAVRMGLVAEVTYFIKVELIRKGRFRQNERIKAFFYYLPRTFAPLPQCELLSPQDEKSDLADHPNDWRRFEVSPTHTRGAAPTNVTDLRVSLCLQKPFIYASSSSIPFSLIITSGVVTEAISLLLSSLSVQLIRLTTIRVGVRWIAFETLLGGGDVVRVEERANERSMFGSVTHSHLGESSWRLESVDVKYIMRVKVSPRSDMPSLAATLPTFVGNVPVTMKTHETSTDGDTDATTPALCRFPWGGRLGYTVYTTQ
ncbi:hypothetical protein JB92DRAFT_127162 [Gautieria morchelliformis]|nr:hypothetical protein JB92DRAFT_127162 [Gautieria morchelliformis]